MSLLGEFCISEFVTSLLMVLLLNLLPLLLHMGWEVICVHVITANTIIMRRLNVLMGNPLRDICLCSCVQAFRRSTIHPTGKDQSAVTSTVPSFVSPQNSSARHTQNLKVILLWTTTPRPRLLLELLLVVFAHVVLMLMFSHGLLLFVFDMPIITPPIFICLFVMYNDNLLNRLTCIDPF